MIKAIDSLLQVWAQELHSDFSSGGMAGGNMVAMMMESNGQLIRGRRASRAPLETSLDIELIVTKHLSADLEKVVGADTVLATGQDGIATGSLVSLDGHVHDLREPKTLGAMPDIDLSYPLEPNPAHATLPTPERPAP